jgi:uncharacterized protein
MRLLFVLWILFFTPQLLLALDIPVMSSPVVDEANILSKSVEQDLRKHLLAIHQKGGPQLQILSLSSLDGLSIEQASIEIVDKWKVGDADRDDGVLLLIAPKERKVRIEVGQGLEGALPDVIAARIIREIILPNFKNNNFDGGVVLGVQYILQSIWPQSDELHVEKLVTKTKKRSLTEGRVFFLNVLLIVLFVFISVFRSRGGGGGFRSSHYGGYGSTWSRGGFGSSGRSGGSWGGGGGGFSGGGSSGSW